MSLLRQGGVSTLIALCHYFLCHFLLGEGGVSGEKYKALLFTVFFILKSSLRDEGYKSKLCEAKPRKSGAFCAHECLALK